MHGCIACPKCRACPLCKKCKCKIEDKDWWKTKDLKQMTNSKDSLPSARIRGYYTWEYNHEKRGTIGATFACAKDTRREIDALHQRLVSAEAKIQDLIDNPVIKTIWTSAPTQEAPNKRAQPKLAEIMYSAYINRTCSTKDKMVYVASAAVEAFERAVDECGFGNAGAIKYKIREKLL